MIKMLSVVVVASLASAMWEIDSDEERERGAARRGEHLRARLAGLVDQGLEPGRAFRVVQRRAGGTSGGERDALRARAPWRRQMGYVSDEDSDEGDMVWDLPAPRLRDGGPVRQDCLPYAAHMRGQQYGNSDYVSFDQMEFDADPQGYASRHRFAHLLPAAGSSSAQQAAPARQAAPAQQASQAGIDASPGTEVARRNIEEISAQRDCVVCHVAPREMLCIECGHMTTCAECATTIAARYGLCPIDRHPCRAVNAAQAAAAYNGVESTLAPADIARLRVMRVFNA